MDLVFAPDPYWAEEAPEPNLNGLLRFGVGESVGHRVWFAAISMDSVHILLRESRGGSRRSCYRCRCCKQRVNVDGVITHKARCSCVQEMGPAWVIDAAAKFAVFAAVFECGDQAADDYDRRLFGSWRRYMRSNGQVPTEEQWEDLNAFAHFVTGLESVELAELRMSFVVGMRDVRELNSSSPQFRGAPVDLPVPGIGLGLAGMRFGNRAIPLLVADVGVEGPRPEASAGVSGGRAREADVPPEE